MTDQPQPTTETPAIAHQEASPLVRHLIEKFGPKNGNPHDEKRFVLSVARIQDENAKGSPQR